MFRKSRIKIVIAIMVSVVAILFISFGVSYYTSYRQLYQENVSVLERFAYSYENGMPLDEIVPNISMPNRKSDRNIIEKKQLKNADGDTASMKIKVSTFYAVVYDSDNEVIEYSNVDGASLTDEQMLSTAEDIVNLNKEEGVYGSLIYIIKTFQNADNEDRTIVVMIDNALISDSISVLLRNTIISNIVILIIIFFTAIAVAGVIIKPLQENYDKQKRFISDAGHELKTPVAAIEANVEVLRDEIGDNKWLENIDFESRRMSELVKSLLTLARTESIAPKKEEMDLSRVIIGCILPFETLAFEKGFLLDYDGVAEDISFCGDRGQIEQLITILVDNAISHATAAPDSADGQTDIEHNKIIISLVRNGRLITYKISNPGKEISPEQFEKMFDRFYTEDNSRTESGHYGLGLSIAKAVVTAHKGKITGSSSNGVNTFVIEFPV